MSTIYGRALRALRAKAEAAVAAGEPEEDRPWQWPIDVTRYDRRAALTESERALLAEHAAYTPVPGQRWQWYDASRQALSRLMTPLADVVAILSRGTVGKPDLQATSGILCGMHRTGRSFWGWTGAEWAATTERRSRAGRSTQVDGGFLVPVMAYALDCWSPSELPGPMILFAARRFFGESRMAYATARVRHALRAWGYALTSQGDREELESALAFLFFLNRSPRVEDLTLEQLAAGRTALHAARNRKSNWCFAISRVLADWGILHTPLPRSCDPGRFPKCSTEGIASDWMAWVDRWRATTTLSRRTAGAHRAILYRLGRWLGAHHPTITSPAHWTRELCAEWVAAVDRLAVGTFGTRSHLQERQIGLPIRPRTKAAYLGATCTFFHDAQEWEWIERRFSPARALMVPTTVRRLMGPAPRVIADDLWAKLLMAGLSLTEADIAAHTPLHRYPAAMIRAIAVIWLFGGLRMDEIRRLELGCVRWQRRDGTPVALGLHDDPPPDVVCLLSIPANKTSGPFTKPVDPPIGLAIRAWEREARAGPPVVDRKTGLSVRHLFAVRAQASFGKDYINRRLIPMLCAKQNIPVEDARGRLSSHRARATIATQLAPRMGVFHLQKWLGHKHLASTQHYVDVSPTKLIEAYADADYFKRNVRLIQVLVDVAALRAGAADRGEPWKYYALGNGGLCGYDHFQKCPHRLACKKCVYYVDGDRAALMTQRADLERYYEEMPLTDEQKRAVDGDIQALTKLIDDTRHTPPPAPSQPSRHGSLPVLAGV